MCHSKYMEIRKQCSGLKCFHFSWHPGIKVRLSSGDDVHWLWSLLWSSQLKRLYFLLFNYFVLKNMCMKSNLWDYSRTREKVLKPLKSRKKRSLGVQVWRVDFDFIWFVILLNWSSFLPSNFCKVPIVWREQDLGMDPSLFMLVPVTFSMLLWNPSNFHFVALVVTSIKKAPRSSQSPSSCSSLSHRRI